MFRCVRFLGTDTPSIIRKAHTGEQMGWRKCTIPLNHACSDAGFEPFEQESEHVRYAGCVVASSRLNYEVQEQQNRAEPTKK